MTTIKHTLCDTHNINLRRICTYKKSLIKSQTRALSSRTVIFLQKTKPFQKQNLFSLQGNDIFLLLRPVLLLKLLSENSNPQKFLELYYLD